MKKCKILFLVIVSFSYLTIPLEPGCIRQNSNEIRRTLLFMQIEQGHMDLVINLLDIDTMSLKSVSGNTITQVLQKVKSEKKMNIEPVLLHLKKLEKEKYLTHPIPDLPD